MLVEQGKLRRVGGVDAEPPAELPMPDSVHAVIANRVDLLDPADRAVLQAAAVVGRSSGRARSPRRSGRPVDGGGASLRRLEQRDLIHEQAASTMAGQTEYRFGHVLVRDVCYQRLPRTERVARHERTADWLDASPPTATPTWPRCSPTTGTPRTRSPGTLGLDTAPLRRAGPRRDAPGGPADVRAARPRRRRRARRLGAGPAATRAPTSSSGCGSSCSPPRSPSTPTREAFLAGGGADQLADAGRAALPQPASGPAPPGPGRCCGQAAWLRADRLGALSCLDRAVELFDELPDAAEKADALRGAGPAAHAQLRGRAGRGRGSAAAEIADRLGLAEVATNARITMAAARTRPATGPAWSSCGRSRVCRSERLLALRRAAQNLAWALREDGDWTALQREADRGVDSRGGQAIATGYSDEAMRAYFEGRLPPAARRRRRLRRHPRRGLGHAGTRHLGQCCGCCATSRCRKKKKKKGGGGGGGEKKKKGRGGSAQGERG